MEDIAPMAELRRDGHNVNAGRRQPRVDVNVLMVAIAIVIVLTVRKGRDDRSSMRDQDTDERQQDGGSHASA